MINSLFVLLGLSFVMLCHRLFCNQCRKFKENFNLIKGVYETEERLKGCSQSNGVLGKVHYLTGMRQLFAVVTSARIKMINSGFLSQHLLAP